MLISHVHTHCAGISNVPKVAWEAGKIIRIEEPPPPPNPHHACTCKLHSMFKVISCTIIPIGGGKWDPGGRGPPLFRLV